MALHFDRGEYADRMNRLKTALDERGLDGILLFAQESMYWLTGYDTFGFCFFQCLYVGGDGTLALLTRSPDLRQARHTSIIEDIRVWTDERGARPEIQLREMLDSLGAKGKKLGIEYNSYGLTAYYGKAVDAAFADFCELVDASGLVDALRAVKSEAELAYVRRAGELADAAYDAAVELTRAGADEGDILAAMHSAIFSGGGDYPGNEFIIGSGEDALLVRYKAGRRKLSANDQLTLEWAGVYRHYHAAMMQTFVIGDVPRQQIEMHDICREALAACEEQLRPGRTAGDVFEAYAKTADDAGYQAHRLNACGYSLGAKFTPSWMDWPMFYRGNDAVIQPGMVLFAHMVLLNSDAGYGMTLGRSYIITEDGPESLSRTPLDMVRK